MILARIAVNRPVATLMFFISIFIFGSIFWYQLPQDLFPKITYPQVTVVTSYPDAAPEEIETLITKPLEESLSTVQKMRTIKSISREGISIITIEFGWESKMDFAALRVRQKIDLIKERLPREAKAPVVKKINPFESPILVLSLQGDMNQEKLLKFARKILKEKLAKIDGVASVTIQGGQESEIYIDVDASMLRASNLDLTKITKSLKDTNLNYPAGTTKEKYYQYLIRTKGEYETINEIGETVIYANDSEENIKTEDYQGIIKLKDISKIRKGYKQKTSISRFNGLNNIMLSVYKQSDANTIQTVDNLRNNLDFLTKYLDKPVLIDIVYDQSSFIKNAINGVKSSGITGALLAFFILLLFLKSFSSALIVSLTIPVSLFISFIFMKVFGLSVNMMSLGGLALGVGMLVDSSIVVMENISRKKSQISDRKKAIIEGTSQVWTAIFASTCTTVAVFLPMVFLTGIEGQLFKELALTVTFSLFASLFVSLSLIPRLVSKRRPAKIKNGFFMIFEEKVKHLELIYLKILKKSLHQKKKVFSVVTLLLIIATFIMLNLPRETLPLIDEGQFLINLTMPAGTRLNITDIEVRKIEDELLKDKNVQNISVNIGSDKEEITKINQMLGSHQAYIAVVLNKDKNISTTDYIQKLFFKLTSQLSKRAIIDFQMNSSGLSRVISDKSLITLNIYGNDSQKLNNKAKELFEYLKDIQGLINIRTTYTEPAPETQIKINKRKAAMFGLSSKEISLATQTAIKGKVATKFKDKEGVEIPIRVRLKEKFRTDFSYLQRIPLWTGRNSNVSLGDLVDIQTDIGPSEIRRIEQRKVIVINADIQKNFNYLQVKKDVLSLIRDLDNKNNIEIKLLQESASKKQTYNQMFFTLLLSILFVYMIMASQFESLLQPLIIMITVPFGIIGVSFTLLITGNSINTVSSLGMILLAGIVVNNGIVLIEYINQIRDRLDKVTDAVMEACKVRFRPIIMTTITTILGLTPLVLGLGEGSELRTPLAVTVIGGLLISTLLTLIVLPLLYLSFYRKVNEK